MRISTFLIVAGMFIISLYFLIEVNYYASAQNLSENASNTPYIKIPKLNVKEGINNKSISYGVYHEPQSSIPDNGTVIIFGHRTSYGSPFLDLDKVKEGDNITLQWPGVGNVEYKVTRSFIVPSSYRMSVDQGKVLFLITCYPLGSTSERLIIEARQENIYPLQDEKTKDQSKTPYAILLMGIFLAGGVSLSYLYPVKEERTTLLITTIALTLLLVLGFLFPLPTDWLALKLSNISSWFGG